MRHLGKRHFFYSTLERSKLSTHSLDFPLRLLFVAFFFTSKFSPFSVLGPCSFMKKFSNRRPFQIRQYRLESRFKLRRQRRTTNYQRTRASLSANCINFNRIIMILNNSLLQKTNWS